MIRTRTFIPPTMCDCRLSVTAEWADKETGDSYRHPKPFTITGLEILTQCNQHNGVTNRPVDDDPWADREGYMVVPEEPTDAEKLYIYLARFTGLKEGFIDPDTGVECGCTDHLCHDEKSKSREKKAGHPKNTRLCKKHRKTGGHP